MAPDNVFFNIGESRGKAKGGNQVWVILDRPIDTGKTWLMAHVGDWDNPMVGDGSFKPAYLEAHEVPDPFVALETSTWSQFGKTPEAPKPRECR